MRYLTSAVKFTIISILVFFFSSCKQKEKVDEIVPLKDVMGVFERGVLTQDRAVLDSVYSTRGINRDSLINSLLLEISNLKSSGSTTGGEVKNLQFTRRRFSIPEGKDSARVELTFSGENIKGEKNLEVFLKKSKGEWKIVGLDIK
ncbi:MAG: hypothetical protein MUP17_08885 [candidate division Zixibacteria bacterium]|nr:hypothetical protein [candidate division Zixibacteria bacterium]